MNIQLISVNCLLFIFINTLHAMPLLHHNCNDWMYSGGVINEEGGATKDKKEEAVAAAEKNALENCEKAKATQAQAQELEDANTQCLEKNAINEESHKFSNTTCILEVTVKDPDYSKELDCQVDSRQTTCIQRNDGPILNVRKMWFCNAKARAYVFFKGFKCIQVQQSKDDSSLFVHPSDL